MIGLKSRNIFLRSYYLTVITIRHVPVKSEPTSTYLNFIFSAIAARWMNIGLQLKSFVFSDSITFTFRRVEKKNDKEKILAHGFADQSMIGISISISLLTFSTESWVKKNLYHVHMIHLKFFKRSFLLFFFQIERYNQNESPQLTIHHLHSWNVNTMQKIK